MQPAGSGWCFGWARRQTVTAERMGEGRVGIICKMNGHDRKVEVLHVSGDAFSFSSVLLLPCILWPLSLPKPSDSSSSSWITWSGTLSWTASSLRVIMK